MLRVAARKCINGRTYALTGWADKKPNGRIAIKDLQAKDDNSNFPVPSSVLTIERRRFVDALIHNAECVARNNA